jgi:hypothetical protein
MTEKFNKEYKNLVKKYGKKEVDTGIDIESEHGKNKERQLKIASDHLEEFPNYYQELDKMEKKLKKKK